MTKARANATAEAAKGDLRVGSGSNTTTVLGVGADGSTLVANSSNSSGLGWAGNQSAGKNAVINGGMDVWQRGTSSSTLGAYTTADRWWVSTGAGTGTFAQETTIIPSGSQYALKFTASATANPFIQQAIETLNAVQFAGKTVTLSAQVAASTSTSMQILLAYSTTNDTAITGSWTNITASSGGSATPTSTTYVPLVGTFVVPSTAKSLRVLIQTGASIATSVVIYMGQVQLELGSNQTTFTRAGGTFQGELAACQRYYYRTQATNAYQSIAMGLGATTTDVRIQFKMPTTMRTTPTAVEYSTLRISDYTNNIAVSSLTGSLLTPDTVELQCVVTGATQFRTYILQANNSTSAYVGVTAEL